MRVVQFNVKCSNPIQFQFMCIKCNKYLGVHAHLNICESSSPTKLASYIIVLLLYWKEQNEQLFTMCEAMFYDSVELP